MKKQLMAATALVAAGMLAGSAFAQEKKKASKPTLTVGGWFESILGIVDDDKSVPNHIAVDVQNDGELHFSGGVTLDNGINIRTRVEFETQAGSGPTNRVDEAYMTIAGSFGSIRIGSEDNAAHLLVTPLQGSWATNVGQNLAFDVADWIEPPPGITSLNVNRLDLGDADSEKISYFTPRIEGLQLGVSYMPSFNEGQDGRPERTSDAVHEGFAVAARYDRKIDKIGIGLAAGYATAHPQAGLDQSDPGGVAAGAKVSFGGFTAAIGYHNEWSLSAETAADDGGSEEWNFGIKYVTGKDNFSVGFAHAEAEGTRANTGEDELDQLMVSYRRDLGPGVQYRLNVMYADFDGEDVGSADDNDGYAITTSIRLAF